MTRLFKFLNVLTLTALLSISGCSFESKKPLKLVANSWIGYTPLFYANEIGWLKEHNIQLSNVVSLGESLALFENAAFDGFLGTQFEYLQAKQVHPDLIPILLINKSNGGDMVLSDTRIESLQNTDQIIDVYLELNSVNYIIFKDFIKIHNLSDKSFNYINQDQLKINASVKTRLTTTNPSTPQANFLVITYDPYNFSLLSNGLQMLDSTANPKTLLVVDAIFALPQTIEKHQQQFKTLKKLIDKSITKLQEDPRHFYENVQGYLESMSYEEFITSTTAIEWLNKGYDTSIEKRLEASGFDLSGIIKE